MRSSASAALLSMLALAGCTVTPLPPQDADMRSDNSLPACGYSSFFFAPGLYDALANASSGDFTNEQWAPTLPYENATLRALWRNYSLFYVARTFGEVADFNTSIGIRPRGDSFEIFGSAEANVSASDMRANFFDFAKDTVVADDTEIERWATAFAHSRGASAYRDGIPGNATPDGQGPFREYQEGPIYEYSYDVTINATSRIQDLLDTLPLILEWNRTEAETGRMLYRHNSTGKSWSVWFEQPRNHLDVGDIRISAFPTGEAFTFLSRTGLTAAEAFDAHMAAFENATLPTPPIAAPDLSRLPCHG